MSKTVGVALIGCGEIGAANAASIERAPGVRLVTCFDPVTFLATELAATHSATAHTNIDDALGAPGVHCALICTPHDTHADLAELALQSGHSVLLEKPIAASLADAVRIAKHAGADPNHVAVLLPLRSDPRFEFVRRILADGALGVPIGAVATYLIHKPPPYFIGGYSGRVPSNWRMLKRRAGGGVLIMNLFHHLDALAVLLGEPNSVHAQFVPAVIAPEVDDVATLTVVFGSVLATFVGAGSVVGGPGEQIRIWGTEGHLTLLPEAEIVTSDGTVVRPERCPVIDSRAVAIERFARSIAVGAQPDATVENVLMAQGIVAAAYASHKVGRGVLVRDILRDVGWTS
jgi:predicted dehydrogenase